MRKIRNTYLPFLPISSEKTARMLERESVWSILEHIRESGFEGRTVKEVAEGLDEPLSTVYAAVDALEKEGYIKGLKPSKLKKWGRHKIQKTKGKAAKRFFEACELRTGISHRREGEEENPWGDVVFTPEFYYQIGALINKQSQLKQIHSLLIDLVRDLCTQRIPKELNGLSKKLLPSNEICANCNRSHEGFEFLKAIILYVATEALDSGDFKSLIKELDYRH